MTYNRKCALTALFLAGFVSSRSDAYFIDGSGHFAIRGETRTNPEFQRDQGTYQANELSLNLYTELKASDRASFNLRLGLFDSPHYLGDDAEPSQCNTRTNSDGSTTKTCEDRNQSTLRPGYKRLVPTIHEAYGKYAFDYCILTVGRRSRDTGLGILNNSSKKPFQSSPSVFDGATCDVNIQKQQDLGFYFGFDKLQETGVPLNSPYDRRGVAPDSAQVSEFNGRKQPGFGANANRDDLDQYFFGIMVDDLKTKDPSSSFAKQVGIYFSNILGDEAGTDIKFFDLYTAVYFRKFSFKNELVFRLGKSTDPNIIGLGGKWQSDEGQQTKNDVQSIGLAGEMEYVFSESGKAIGPQEFNQGDATRHSAQLTYAYAPGDNDGYFVDGAGRDGSNNESNRNSKAKAMSFHPSYKPALLLFNSKVNSKATSEALEVDGIYSSDSVQNAALFALGYRYENQQVGTFDFKVISARMLEGLPGTVKSYYDQNPGLRRPIGYEGLDLGTEIDLLYSWRYRNELTMSGGIAGAIPGKAFKVNPDSSPAFQLGVMAGVGFQF
jgi:hypothetical protein